MFKRGIRILMMIYIIIDITSCMRNSNQLSTSKAKEVHLSKTTNKSIEKVSKQKASETTLAPYPTSITVVVNNHYYLPENYEPKDLVYPNVPFLFKEKIEKRKMRREAALALEKMFAAAKKDGIYLKGVSAYRSYNTQKALFNNYVKTDGFEKAKSYSAIPGTSEHQTGLAIDVSGSAGKCAAQSCFAKTKEAAWLNKNSAKYGFIIRYPKRKEFITGYQYEPWHIRYVGKISKTIKSQGITLEEYSHVYPVAKNK